MTAMKELFDESQEKIQFWTPLKKISTSRYIDENGTIHDSSDTKPFFDLPFVSGYDTWKANRTLTGYGTALNYKVFGGLHNNWQYRAVLFFFAKACQRVNFVFKAFKKI